MSEVGIQWFTDEGHEGQGDAKMANRLKKDGQAGEGQATGKRINKREKPWVKGGGGVISLPRSWVVQL